jgi:serine/threonine protein kinase
LQELIAELHRRRIAYVDTNKPENILLGDDGKPHLIDFQISWDHHVLLRHFQREDLYHVLKHKRRLRRDEMSEEELRRAEHKSWLIRLHRIVFKPYFLVRRRMFKHLRETGRLMPEGSK